MQTNSILNQYQFGFRKNYSTTLALIEVIDKIYQNQNEGKLCAGVCLDLQKAFDTVNHDILLHKLYNYGVCGVVHDWFRNYLTNRQQFICVAGIQSSVSCVSCGAPQGSVPGPLLLWTSAQRSLSKVHVIFCEFFFHVFYGRLMFRPRLTEVRETFTCGGT